MDFLKKEVHATRLYIDPACTNLLVLKNTEEILSFELYYSSVRLKLILAPPLSQMSCFVALLNITALFACLALSPKRFFLCGGTGRGDIF